MTDTAARLCGPAALTGSAATQYTVPAATQTIVRSIRAVNTDPTVEAMFTLSVGADADATRIFHTAIPALGALDWKGFLVLATTEILQAAAVAGTVTLTINGIEVTA